MLPLLSAPAHAHEIGLSYGRLDGEQLTIVVAAAEVDGGFDAADLATTRLTTDGVPCELGAPAALGTVEGDGLGWTLPARCPSGERLTWEAPWLDGLSDGHRHVVSIDGEPAGVLEAGEVIVVGRGGAEVAADYVALGVEHVLTGWDHLAFLVGLLLVARSAREIAGIVTGFTIAHSITLSAAALGLVAVPGRLVEPLIALSVVWVGIENRWEPPPGRRLALTFGLGLIHGLGFAGLLRELGLPAGHAVTALLGFNVGVELGQLAVVALLLPVLLALREREGWVRRAVPALSAALAVLGGYWFVERLVAP